jgi:hypothetical protein
MEAHMSNSNAENFLARYQAGMEGFQILAVDFDDEGSFSCYPCDVCGSHLGGTRYKATMCNPGLDGDEIEVSICTDCVMFSANGDLPTEE